MIPDDIWPRGAEAGSSWRGVSMRLSRRDAIPKKRARWFSRVPLISPRHRRPRRSSLRDGTSSPCHRLCSPRRRRPPPPLPLPPPPLARHVLLGLGVRRLDRGRGGPDPLDRRRHGRGRQQRHDDGLDDRPRRAAALVRRLRAVVKRGDDPPCAASSLSLAGAGGERSAPPLWARHPVLSGSCRVLAAPAPPANLWLILFAVLL